MSVWERKGTQGDNWKLGQLDILKEDGNIFDVLIKGTMGDGKQGDIAIDDISFNAGRQCQYSKFVISSSFLKETFQSTTSFVCSHIYCF